MDRTWPYMFEPVVSTLLEGARKTLSGFDVQEVLLPTPVINSSFLKLFTYGDVAVCVGPLVCPRLEWNTLKRHHVRTIYFQTEPTHRCLHFHGVDEVWDFSWHNIEACRLRSACTTADPCVDQGCMRCAGHAVLEGPAWQASTTTRRACAIIGDSACGKQFVLRYVPLGALNNTPVAQHLDTIDSLTFLGNAHYRDDGCWRRIQAHMPHNTTLAIHSNIWSNTAFAQLLGSHQVFVNVHKSVKRAANDWETYCGDAHNPATFRFAKLLNAHALLISERCDRLDEAEFSDLVTFSDFESIGGEFERLRRLNVIERRARANKISAEFISRFDPGAIFVRAGIVESLLGS